MDIKEKGKAFVIENETGDIIAQITYQYETDNIIVANSTFVDPSLRGQGIAKRLLDKLADFARENDLKIRPLCSYVVKAFEKSKEYGDVALK